jgi:hypothetical protein
MEWFCTIHSTSDNMVVLNQSNGGLPLVVDETRPITFGYSGKCGGVAEIVMVSKLSGRLQTGADSD